MAEMALKIYSPKDDGFVQEIKWNFDELKGQIQNAAQDYEKLVYTDDSIKAAKADRAKLNKFVDALKAKRTEVRKQLLKPDEKFGKEVEELTKIVQKAITNIDDQVKAYEKRQREEKTAKIRDFYEENIHDLGEYLPFERVFRPEYANASTTMKSVKEEILDQIQRVAEGLAILNEVDSPYTGDMKAVFLNTYDIGAALAEKNRLEAQERKRQEYEQSRIRQQAEREQRDREQAQRLIAAGNRATVIPDKVEQMSTPTRSISQESGVAVVQDSAEVVTALDFRVYVTRAQMLSLKQFLQESGIRFEPVPKQ